MPTVTRVGKLRRKRKKEKKQYAEIPKENPRRLPYGVMTPSDACHYYPMISFRIPRDTKLVTITRDQVTGLTVAFPYE